MARFFNFYDPLEKRYVFNSFLVVVGLVEILILVFTLIWSMDEGIFTDHPKIIPFPWTTYLLAVFVAPIVLLFLFGVIIQGLTGSSEYPRDTPGGPRGLWGPRLGRIRYLLGLRPSWGFWGSPEGENALPLAAAAIKFIGLGR